MSDEMKSPLRPDDYWPQAGELLDAHFAQKRRRRLAAWLLLLLFFSSGSYYLLRNSETSGDKWTQIERTATSAPYQQPATNQNIDQPVTTQQAERNETGAAVTTPAEQPETILRKGKSTAAIKPVHNRTIAASGLDRRRDDQPPLKQTNQIVTEGNSTDVIFAQENGYSTMPLMGVLPVRDFSRVQLPDSFPARYQHKMKQRGRLELLAYAGLQQSAKELSGESSYSVIRRREQEENPVLLPYAGLQLSVGKGQWDFRAGVELAVMGERINYSPYANGIYYNVYQDWQPYTYSVTDTDSTFIFGILFLNTSTQTLSDSQLVNVTDTLNGIHYDPAIASVNGINRWYTLEFPIEAAYSMRQGRWGFGITAGVAPGILIREDSRYLRDDEDGIYRPDMNTSSQWSLNLRAGLEFSYILGARTRLLLRPSARYFINQLPSGERIDQRYRAFGCNAGIVYSIR